MKQTSGEKRVIPTEVYARVVGYYRSVSSWNDGKQQEWKTRTLCKCSDMN